MTRQKSERVKKDFMGEGERGREREREGERGKEGKRENRGRAIFITHKPSPSLSSA